MSSDMFNLLSKIKMYASLWSMQKEVILNIISKKENNKRKHYLKNKSSSGLYNFYSDSNTFIRKK